ncbi:hypothetical protein [Micromonospora sp. NPDC049301]|uniref:hypothetical protein n=1 Tax=Micromonospora sp. NPDC049301 TaxID=3155723 RepID=UPI00341EB313
MGSRFSFTDEALANLRVYDVTPGEVWEALHSARRVIRHLGDDVMVVYAASGGAADWRCCSPRPTAPTTTGTSSPPVS